ncbi:Transcription initiation factor TFIID subunit 5 [Scheffersomyces spartinae]|uniref:Transcription initiation factor TFIID subunit 5 n=1 Tax=Scheffersomyces spartinae TaxID=45513 RepID=A0A9P8AI30_9ASCO|nr:Transcription initiation factor TFIID subunit 5 [Scheffersomyces spartinae]KAG7192719.1 Transcription initiation factor TFIID subunit 5 [Scheffersomyces spartinae]
MSENPNSAGVPGSQHSESTNNNSSAGSTSTGTGSGLPTSSTTGPGGSRATAAPVRSIGGVSGGTNSGTAPGGGGAARTAAAGARGPQQQMSQADLNKIVLDYLSKKGYHRSEEMLRMESSNMPTPASALPTPQTTSLASPNEMFKQERDLRDKLNKSEREIKELKDKQMRVERELRDTRDREAKLAKEHQLRELKEQEEKLRKENDRDLLYRCYNMLRKWVDTSLDLYKPELIRITYPIFVHGFLELVSKNFIAELKKFLDTFQDDHIVLHGDEIKQLAGISLPDHLKENELAQAYRNNKYTINVSRTTMNLLLYFLHENEAVGGDVLIRIINQYINPVIDTTRPDRVNLEGEADPNEGLPGFYTSSKTNEVDKFNSSQPVSLGKLPQDPEVSKEIEAELKIKDENSEPVNGITLVEQFKELTEPDKDSPARESIPLPLKDYSDIKRQILAVEDSRLKIRLDTIQPSAPSVCMYTFHNTNNEMNCLEFNEDSNMIAGGFQDSYIKLWSIDGKPLKSVFKRDNHNQDNTRKLIGHSGPVYGLSFSPDNKFLLSSSEDRTVRLWSLDSYTALVSYKGHNLPVWDVKFSPFGHYFATASQDQTARLWATDHIYPLRIFAGHVNDVDCVDFHPNANYVFTGSSDKTCRMWDVQTGNCVRVFMGHTGAVNCMAVSPDGRWLASAGEDTVVNIWDCGTGRRLKTMRGHGRSSIYSLAWSRDNAVLVSGGADNTVRVWDVKKNTADEGPTPEAFISDAPTGSNFTEANGTAKGDGQSSNNHVGENSKDGKAHTKPADRRKEIVSTSDHMTVYFTKKTPVYKVHFTRRNLCLAGGGFLP